MKNHKMKNAILFTYTDVYNKKNFIFNCKSINPILYESNFEIYNISKNPKISIIIPIYNKSLFLKNIICSLENQKIKDIEIIFVDDFSSDNSTKIIEKYIIRDKRIKLIKNHKNMGVFYSRYNGFKYSKGKYILFIDPDDLLFNILNEIYDFIEKKKVDIVQFDKLYLKNNKFYKILENNIPNKYITRKELKYYLFNENSEIKNIKFSHRFLWDKLVKREVILNIYRCIGNKYLYTHLITWDDTLITFFLFRNAKSYMYMNKIGYLWNIEDKERITNSIINRKIANKKLHDIFYYLEIIFEKTERDNEQDNEAILNIFLFFNYFFHKKLFKYINQKNFILGKKVMNKYMKITFINKKYYSLISEIYKKMKLNYLKK